MADLKSCRCLYPTLSRLELCGPRGDRRYRQETCDYCGGRIESWADKQGAKLAIKPEAGLTRARVAQAARLHQTAVAAAASLGVRPESFRRACRRHKVLLPSTTAS